VRDGLTSFSKFGRESVIAPIRQSLAGNLIISGSKGTVSSCIVRRSGSPCNLIRRCPESRPSLLNRFNAGVKWNSSNGMFCDAVACVRGYGAEFVVGSSIPVLTMTFGSIA
jgi:hypothetical protein